MIKTTKQLLEENIIPKWLGESLRHDCEVCGCPILNNEELTARWCSNISCYSHMQHKGDYMCKRLSIKGVGPATCLETLKRYHLKNHFELLRFVLRDRPRVHLWEIADMACIHTFGSVYWEKELAGIQSFEEYFTSNKFIPKLIRSHQDMLIDAQKYFTIKMPLSKNGIKVMITGSIKGFNNRQLFIEKCNDIVGQHLRVTQVNRNNSANYLITENIHSTTDKAEIARRQGIPILSPSEFLYELSLLVQEFI